MRADNDEITSTHEGRRPYAAPQLVRYGAVSELTQAGGSGPSENGSNPCPQVDNTKKFNSSCMN